MVCEGMLAESAQSTEVDVTDAMRIASTTSRIRRSSSYPFLKPSAHGQPHRELHRELHRKLHRQLLRELHREPDHEQYSVPASTECRMVSLTPFF